jgi:hypothetical protein
MRNGEPAPCAFPPPPNEAIEAAKGAISGDRSASRASSDPPRVCSQPVARRSFVRLDHARRASNIHPRCGPRPLVHFPAALTIAIGVGGLSEDTLQSKRAMVRPRVMRGSPTVTRPDASFRLGSMGARPANIAKDRGPGPGSADERNGVSHWTRPGPIGQNS